MSKVLDELNKYIHISLCHNLSLLDLKQVIAQVRYDNGLEFNPVFALRWNKFLTKYGGMYRCLEFNEELYGNYDEVTRIFTPFEPFLKWKNIIVN